MNADRLDRLPKILENYPHLSVDLEEGTVVGKAFTPDKKGRLKTGLWLDNKMYNYFRYEIIAYLGGLDLLDMTVNHKNGICWDDRLGNLETMSIGENLTHAKETGLTRKGSRHNLAKLTEEDVFQIKKMAKGDYGEIKAISDMYEVTPGTIRDILTGKTWVHVECEVPPIYSDSTIPWKNRKGNFSFHTKLGKPVVQKTLSGDVIKEWASISEAARETGTDKGGISLCCRGKQTTSGGFKWEYADEK